jgi:F0F1-type ATP synthase epsilon subunit
MLDCTITSTEKTEKYEEVQWVILPAHQGRMQVLPGHAEMFVTLREGIIMLPQSDGHEISRQITGGECHIKDNHVIVVL